MPVGKGNSYSFVVVVVGAEVVGKEDVVICVVGVGEIKEFGSSVGSLCGN